MPPLAIVDQRFAIERFVRSGGMGAVYRALDHRTGRPVALKLLLGTPVPEDEVRFEREALALSELDHPGIVRYVAHGVTTDERPYLAMEWIDGEDLGERLARGPLSVGEVLTLSLRLSMALGAAHARGVVHRDLKPSNILLAGGALDQPKIVDFGLAAFPEATRVTAAGIVLGTAAYIAPERAQGDIHLEPRADVFSLGCILHECITGKAAFDAKYAMAVLVKIVFEEVPRLRDLGHAVPRSLDALIARMLAKDPAQRPAGGAAVAAALAALDDQPVRSTHRTWWPGRLSLTRSEQRVVCLMVAKAPRAAAPTTTDDTLSSLDPEVPRRVLEAIEEHGGRVLTLADGTLVVTTKDAGLAVDQAAHAAGCALGLRAVLQGWAIAVVTGRAEVAAERAVGDAIERAAQMVGARLSLSEEEAIDLDDVTAGLLDLRFDVRVGALGLELCGERDVAEAARTLLGRPTPFVGRKPELSFLHDLFAKGVDESVAHAVVLTGGAGVGKSRLRQEFVERLRAQGGVEIWVARGDPMRTGAPFGVIAQLIQWTARLVGGEPVEARRQKLLARVSRYVSAQERLRVAEFLGELAGTPFPDEGRVQLRAARQDPRLLGDQMRHAWVDLVSAEMTDGPLVIVLEDLHWGDATSVEYLDTALRLLADRPLFVLALGRPELYDRRPGLFRHRKMQKLHLTELPRRACEQLIRAVLGEDVAPEIVTRLRERSAGNAFFLEELLRATAEGRDGGRLETMLAMVGSRLDTLDPEDRRTLRAASVFGDVFWRGGLMALLDAEVELTHLEDKELIIRRRSAKFYGEEEYAFRHTLVREAAYGMLVKEDRALGHHLAATWLEAAGETDALVLAEHFERGGNRKAAAGWTCVAAEQALEGGDLPAVLSYVDRAVFLGATGEELGRLSLARAIAHNWRAEHAEAEPWAERALNELRRSSARWCAAIEEMIWAAGQRGDGALVARRSEELLSLGVAEEALVPRLVALTRAVNWLVLTGRHPLAHAILLSLDPIIDGHRDEPMVQAAVAAALACFGRSEDDPRERRALFETAIARFEEIGDRHQACLQRTNLAAMCNLLGAFADAEEAARIAAAHAEQLGVRFAIRAAQSNLGPALSRQGAHDEAIRILRAVVADSTASDDHFTTGVTRVYLAEALQRAGELSAAEIELRGALPVLAAFQPYLCLGTAQLADVLLAEGRAEEALTHARAAFELLGSLGQIEEGDALVRAVYAEALDAEGHHEAARAVLGAAHDRLLQYAARFKDEDHRRRFLSEVPENARTLALVARAGLTSSDRGLPSSPPMRG